MRVYKGVAPGTHNAGDAVASCAFASATIDPRRVGFHGDASLVRNADAVVRHIIDHSWPSPFVSVSMSFGVAADYATKGGWVFEIDLGQIPAAHVINPVHELANAFPNLHAHNGHQDLVHAIATPAQYGAILSKPPLAPGANGMAAPKLFYPRISDELHALVFAARDAEFLLLAAPAAAVMSQVYLVP
ncbi:MAG TPA: hypothetical protein VFX59_26585 [Polyangiales bacterium]|nr:hypothetical protein [Polyangiales bacterium]